MTNRDIKLGSSDLTFCCSLLRLDSGEKKEEKSGKSDGVKQIDVGKEAAIEAEVKAARERAVIPLEIRMKQFRDMLAEKEASDLVTGNNKSRHRYFSVTVYFPNSS